MSQGKLKTPEHTINCLREAEVRRQLSRRCDLCDDTYVYTTTLLSAEDQQDTVRWT